MHAGLLDPELEMFPNRHRWTVDACYRLTELGFLEGRFEVLDGEVISKMGQKPGHAQALTRLTQVLSVLFGLDRMRVQAPVSIPGEDGIYNEPEPDMAVTHQSVDSFGDRHPIPNEIALAVEVADTSLRADLMVKTSLYARAGICEYWILDLNGRRLYVNRNPSDGKYTDVTIWSDADSVAPIARPNSLVCIADLLPGA